MVAGDKPAIMRILKATPEFLPSEVVVAEELVDIYLNDPGPGSGYYIFVADVDGEVAGYTCYGPTPLTLGTWDIYWLAVAREYHRQGIGKKLTERAEKEIKRAEGRLILIETSSLSGYEKARRFYDSMGYTIISQIPDYYSVGDDQVLYLKKLK